MTVVTIACLILLILILVGMPISFCFLFSSMLYSLLAGKTLNGIVTAAFYSLDNYTLLALPLFIVAGNVMEASGIASVLVNFGDALLRKVKGGMGALIPISSMFFGALCGSGNATIATVGSILLPRLTKKGWDKRYTCALLAASGPLGYMIPPNLSAILYACVSDVSVGALFLATILPGILWGTLYMLINRIIYTKYNPNVISDIANTTTNTTKKDNNLQNLRATLKGIIPAIIMPVIILGGIYGGIFTATEAGAVSCIYALFAGFCIYRKLNLKNSLTAFSKTAMLLGSFMFVFPMVTIFTRILVINGVPQLIATGMTSISTNRNVILLFIDIIYFILGFFLDAGVLILAVTPLMLPIAHLIGLNVIQMGVILMVAVGVGMLTPPMAIGLFIASDISGADVHEIIKPLIPFLIFAAIPILLLVTYVPAFSLWLPKVVMGISY